MGGGNLTRLETCKGSADLQTLPDSIWHGRGCLEREGEPSEDLRTDTLPGSMFGILSLPPPALKAHERVRKRERATLL